MRHIKLGILTLAAACLTYTGCREEDPAADIRLANITEAVVATSTFEVLEAAVVRANLAGELSGPGPMTVFAPTDDAFQTYLDVTSKSAAIDKVKTLDATTLGNILKYHVVARRLKANELTAGTVATLNGKNFTVDLTGGAKVIGAGNAGNAAKVTAADVEVSNGIIHVIDRVLLP
ncbi:MAG: fasciclin domain-containing protein [Cytophagales bacterium]|jgi:transforming growth factor-beta-induced protein|nr:fasciclin domain-containing protein [Cytophagales bacterium]